MLCVVCKIVESTSQCAKGNCNPGCTAKEIKVIPCIVMHCNALLLTPFNFADTFPYPDECDDDYDDCDDDDDNDCDDDGDDDNIYANSLIH